MRRGDDGEPCSTVVGADAEISTSLRELKAYDSLVARAKVSLSDPRVVSILLHRRKELERSLRGVDPQALKDMEEIRTQGLEVLNQERDKLRKEEMASLEEKKKKKIQAAIKKEKAAAEKVRKGQLKENFMKVDRGDWDKADFGSGAKKLDKLHRANIRDLVTRITFPESNYQLVLVCFGHGWQKWMEPNLSRPVTIPGALLVFLLTLPPQHA